MRDVPTPNIIRRQKMARAAEIMATAMANSEFVVGDLYYSEWLKILQDMQNRIIADMVTDDHKRATETKK